MARNDRIRRTFTPQFKKDAVALLKEGRSATDVAHSLGIARSLLQRWKGGWPRVLAFWERRIIRVVRSSMQFPSASAQPRSKIAPCLVTGKVT